MLTRLAPVTLAGCMLLVLATAAPASAAPYADEDDVVIGDYTWQITTDGSLQVNETTYNDGVAPELGDAWDNGYFAIWDDTPGVSLWWEAECANADLSAPDGNGDVVLTCDSQTSLVGLTVDAQIRLYGEGDLARHLYTISNETDESIDYSWEWYVDNGENELRATTGTPTLGEQDYVNSDVWAYNYYTGSLSGVSVWGLPGVTMMHEEVSSDSSDELYVWNDLDAGGTQLSMAPGESVTLAFFQKVDALGTIAMSVPSSAPASAEAALEPANADVIAAAVAEFASFDGRLVRGLPDGVQVANWEVVDAQEEPELAETGGDQSVVLISLTAGLVLLLAGAGVLVMRRRSAQG